MADQEKIDQDVATSSSSPPPSTPPPAAHSAPSAAPLASSSPSLFVPPPSGSSLPAYPAAPPASAHSVYFAPLPPAYPVPHPHPHAHPHAVQYQPPVMLASPHHAAPPQQPWGYGPQGPPPAAHAQPPLPGHGYAVSPFARPPMHHMPHSHPYPHAAYHVAGPRHSVPTESWGYPAGAAAYAYDHEHQHTQHHPHHPHAAMGSAGPRAMDSSPNQQHTALTKASKKRSRSPSNDKAPAKRPAGLEKRNSSSAGTAKVVERDGQTTTVFQCRGFGDCCMTFTRSEHLARHIRKHTGERPFQCHCGKAFSRLDNLRQHAQTVHSEDVERNEAMMQELTNLHAHLAASAAQAQHAQALIVANQQGHAAAAAAAAASAPGMSSVPMAKRPSKSGKRGSMSNQGQAARSNGEASPTIANGGGDSAAGAQPVNGSSAALPDAHHVASTHETLPSAHLAASPSAAAGSGAPHYHHDAPPMPHYGQPHPQHPGLSYRQAEGPFGEHAPGAPHAHPYGVAPSQHGHPGQWAQRASYPFDPATDAAAHHYHPYSRFATFYGREDEHATPHHMAQQEAEARHRWEQASMPHAGEAAPVDAARAESLARRDSAADVSPRSSAALPPPPPPPGPFGLFGETYTGFQSSLSANQVRTSTLAKAHPISPSLPPTSSQGRPLTASDRPILPPLTGSRPGTSQGSLGALLPPLSPTQLPALRPSSSSGAAGVEGAAGVAGTTAAATGWSSRPPTSSGDLGKAFRFQRRSSMLDLPEMSLDSRPASSQGAGHAAALHAGASNGNSGAAMPPPDGAPPSSRGLGLNSSRGSFSMAPSSSHDRLRPLSSSGRLGSAAFASDPFGRRVSLTREHAEDSSRKSPPHSSLAQHSTSSPFRFQPPPLSRDGSSTAAATFFRDRPLTSHLSRIHSSEGRPGGSSALPTLPTSASRRTARFAEGDSADDDRRNTSQQYQRRASSGGYAAATATSEADERRPTTAAASSSLSPTSSPPGPGSSVAALMKRRPLTSGSDAITAGAPRFGASSARQIIQAATARPGSSAGRGASNGGDIEEGEGKREGGHDEHDEPEERQRPDSSRRVSIASLVGME